MPFNGSGVYTPPAADFPVVTLTVISSTHFNNTINDVATALSTCLTKDGQNTMTANLPGGGFRITNIGVTAIAGSVGTPALNVSDGATGLYRSAANELAVTVNGTQVSRFASIGLIVTGGVTVSGTVTSSIVDSGAGTLVLKGAGTLALTITGANAVFAGTVQGTTLTATTSVVSPILDSGAGSLVLKGAGTTAVTITGANVVMAGNLTLGASPTLATASGNLTLSTGVVATSFEPQFTSAEQAISNTAGTVTTVAHGLGVVPRSVRAVLRCKTAEFGYSIGDEVSASRPADDSANTDSTLWMDSTNVGFQQSSTWSTWRVINRGTTASNAITLANWKLVFYVYK